MLLLLKNYFIVLIYVCVCVSPWTTKPVIDTTIWKSGIWGCKNIEKISFKVVQMKCLAMHIVNQKLSFYILTVGNLQNIFMEHDLYLIS